MDAAEEAELHSIEWKPNDRGTGQRLPAAYIMRKDPNARRAYLHMRSDLGLSHAEAELRIERLADANFRRVLLDDNDDLDATDHRPDMWIELARGFTVEQIFPDLEQLGMVRQGRPN